MADGLTLPCSPGAPFEVKHSLFQFHEVVLTRGMENVVAARRQKLVSYRVSISRMWRKEVFMSRFGDIRMVEESRLPGTVNSE